MRGRALALVLVSAPGGACLGPTGPDAVRVEPPGPATVTRSEGRSDGASNPPSPGPSESPAAPEARPAPIPGPSAIDRLEETFAAEGAQTLRVHSRPARALLAARPGGAPPAALARALPLLAYGADTQLEDVNSALDRALRGEDPPDGYFTFDLARTDAERSERAVAQVERVLEVRRDVIESRVLRLLPDDPAGGASLEVMVVLGLPEHVPIALAPAPSDDASRVLLVDARLVGGASDDALGEVLMRRVTPELFHLRFEEVAALRDAPRAEGTTRLLTLLLNEGTGQWLGLPDALRFDDQGRRTPDADLRARRAMQRFERNLAALVAAETSDADRARLEWTFFNGDDEERWGTFAAALMIDAIDRFDEPARMRWILAEGPDALVDTYVGLAGRHAVVPPLDATTRDLVQRVVAGERFP